MSGYSNVVVLMETVSMRNRSLFISASYVLAISIIAGNSVQLKDFTAVH